MDDSRQTCSDSSERHHDDYCHTCHLWPDRGGERRQRALQHYPGAAMHYQTDAIQCRRDHHQTDCRPRNRRIKVCNHHFLPRNTPIVPRIYIIQHPGRVCGRRRTLAATLRLVPVCLPARRCSAERGGVYPGYFAVGAFFRSSL